MIKLNKKAIPQVIMDHGITWTDIWVDHVNNATEISKADKTRYKHHEIKSSILEETFEKCAYCESKVTHTYPGDIEHILPKKKRPDLFVAWKNLTLGCSICNRKKGDYYNAAKPLINPYNEDPKEHLSFHGPIVLHSLGSRIGERTNLRLDLSRTALIERRTERIKSIKYLIDKWVDQEDESLKILLHNEIIKELGEDREYCATLRTFAKDHANIVT